MRHIINNISCEGELQALRDMVNERLDEVRRIRIANLPPLNDVAMIAVINGKMIDAIRAYRDEFQTDLRDSKNKVDEFASMIYNYRRNIKE